MQLEFLVAVLTGFWFSVCQGFDVLKSMFEGRFGVLLLLKDFALYDSFVYYI